MTATQTLKINQILNKYFGNEEEASIVVNEIEKRVDSKIDQRKEVLATKEDDVSLLQQDVLKFQVEVKKRLNQIILEIVSTGTAVIGLIIAFIKFTK